MYCVCVCVCVWVGVGVGVGVCALVDLACLASVNMVLNVHRYHKAY